MPRGSGWLGRVFVFPGRLLYAGAIAPTDLHAHHAIQIGWTIGGATLRIEDAEGAVFDTAALVVPNDVPHAIRSVCPNAVMLYVDPESREGTRALALSGRSRSAADWTRAAEPMRRSQRLPQTIEEAKTFADDALGSVDRSLDLDVAIHPAVRRTLALLTRSLDRNLRLDGLASSVGLSTGRLRHAFAQEVGIPLRRYVLWRRLMNAAESVRGGGTLTEAAQRAGFVDSAHLTKTFRGTFGLAPSDAMAGIEWVVAAT